jgi:hypothetical protein
MDCAISMFIGLFERWGLKASIYFDEPYPYDFFEALSKRLRGIKMNTMGSCEVKAPAGDASV